MLGVAATDNDYTQCGVERAVSSWFRAQAGDGRLERLGGLLQIVSNASKAHRDGVGLRRTE
jgi:hypothetical protein